MKNGPIIQDLKCMRLSIGATMRRTCPGQQSKSGLEGLCRVIQKMEATISVSGYVFSGNNPVMFTDLLGDQMDPRHYGSWPPPFYFRSNFFSYMDKNGTKWHHRDFMAGTGAEGIPYTEGWGSDGFGDMTTGPGGGHVSHISWGTNQGQSGYRVYWWEMEEEEKGKTLQELKLSMTFKPFSVSMQWNRWEYQNSRNQIDQGWEKGGNSIIGAFGTGWGAKENLINYAERFSPSIKNLKYVKGVKLISKSVIGAQVAVSAVQTYNAWHDENGKLRNLDINNDGNKWGATGKTALDVTMVAIGTFGGPIGWAVSGTYFIGDAFGLWGDWGEAN